MSKYISRISIIFIAIILSLSCMILPASAASVNKHISNSDDISKTKNFANCQVYDEKGLFTDDELKQLNKLVYDTAKDINMYFAIYLSSEARSDDDTQNFADTHYEDLFNMDTNGLIYYMDLSGQTSPYDYISTSGRAMLVYPNERDAGSDNVIDKMLGRIFMDLPASGEEITASQIYKGIGTICSQLETYNEQSREDSIYAHDPYKNTYIYEKNNETIISSTKPLMSARKYIMPGLGVGIIAFLITFFSIKQSYKFKSSCSPMAYVDKGNTGLSVCKDDFLREHVTKVRIQSSSGGGSHGGGGGGGGSHGGGGGHR